jgi:hypothetical protein
MAQTRAWLGVLGALFLLSACTAAAFTSEKDWYRAGSGGAQWQNDKNTCVEQTGGAGLTAASYSWVFNSCMRNLGWQKVSSATLPAQASVQSPTGSPAAQPGWIADSHTGCRAWSINPQPTITLAWSGACQNGLAQGRGVLQFFNDGRPSSRYEGLLRDGKLNGSGVYLFENGNRYDGESHDGVLAGRGTMTYSNGDRYDGLFRDGKRNGRGLYTFNDGKRYDGEFRDGVANGLGQLTAADGNWNGVWKDGCFNDGGRRAWIGVNPSSCP